jgi:hypothetical protein
MQKLVRLLSVIIIVLTSLSFSNNKENCKVLLEPISGSYNGSCKDGLAHGRGTAKGVDTYNGLFNEGLPHGNGTYTYQNGNSFKGQFQNGMKHGSGEFTFFVGEQKMVQKGYWQHDEYVGNNKPTELFRVTERTNILSYSIKLVGESENQIKISFFTAHTRYIPTGLEIVTSRGELLQEMRDFSIYRFTPPNHVSVRYTIMTAGGPRVCALSFIIMQPGKYEVVISND